MTWSSGLVLDTLYFCTVLRRAQGESVPFDGFFCLAVTADAGEASDAPAGPQKVIELLTFFRL